MRDEIVIEPNDNEPPYLRLIRVEKHGEYVHIRQKDAGSDHMHVVVVPVWTVRALRKALKEVRGA